MASKVIDSPEKHSYATEKGHHVIRVTEGERQEVVAKFYEDDRGICGLVLATVFAGERLPAQAEILLRRQR